MVEPRLQPRNLTICIELLVDINMKGLRVIYFLGFLNFRSFSGNILAIYHEIHDTEFNKCIEKTRSV